MGHLGRTWAHLGPSWGGLGAILGHPGAVSGGLGGLKSAISLGTSSKMRQMAMYIRCCSEAFPFGSHPEPSLALLGRIWAHLGPSWGGLGAILGHLAAVLGGLGGLKTVISLGTF